MAGVSVGSLAVRVVQGEARNIPLIGWPMQRPLHCLLFYTGWKADAAYLVSTQVPPVILVVSISLM